MSSPPEYPLLRAASYEMPSTPHQRVPENKGERDMPQETSPLPKTTPRASSTSGVRRSASNDSLRPPSSSATQTTDISFNASDIAAMNETLRLARKGGELPRTTSSPMNVDSVLQDVGFLTRLREARGDPSAPAPEQYTHLLVEVTRKIQERDSALDEAETKREAARRVNNYLRSIEQERYFYDAATAATSPRSSASSSSTPSHSPVNAETFSEEVLSIVENVADQTLSDAAEPLRQEAKRLKSQVLVHVRNNEVQDNQNGVQGWHNEVFARQIAHQGESFAQCVATIASQSALQTETLSYENNILGHQNLTFNQQLSSHLELLQRQEQTVESLKAMRDSETEMVHMSSENLAILNVIISQMSQLAMNLPQAIDDVVANAVQHHVQVGLQDVMQAQQQVMLSLVHEESQRRQPLDYDHLAAKVAENLQKTRKGKVDKPRLGQRIGKVFRRVFRK